MQAYAKPTGKERSMVYDEQSQKWAKAPVPERAPTPEKGEPEETKRSSVQLKRGPEAGVDEPKAKKGSVASTKEQTKAIELKSASEVAKESAAKGAKAAGKAEETSKAEKEKGESNRIPQNLGWS